MLRAIACLLALAATGGSVSKERRFVFEYQATAPAEKGDVHLWVPIPHDDPYQTISKSQVESLLTYSVETDALGNRILSVEGKPGGVAPSVTLRFECVRQEHIQALAAQHRVKELTPEERRRWLAADRLAGGRAAELLHLSLCRDRRQAGSRTWPMSSVGKMN